MTVTQLNLYVKSFLDSSSVLQNIWVVGEISNFTNHYRSGHLYMTLKDEGGLVKAVMFRSSASRLQFTPADGMRVICRGRASLYEKDGQYQLYITQMEPDGLGALAVAYEQLCEKLRNEGLFDQAKKRPIPPFPERIAVITSPTGAAVRDILNILKRRYPVAQVLMCPVQVQGESAVPQLIDAVRTVSDTAAADVIIIGRGGGSMEELWAFNSEALARTIRASRVPVISAVGHETDFTICDFAADLRAPTPSAAAELAVPDQMELLASLKTRHMRLSIALKTALESARVRLKHVTQSRFWQEPTSFTEALGQTVDSYAKDMQLQYIALLERARTGLARQSARLDALSPIRVLGRGYALVQAGGHTIDSVDGLQVGDCAILRLQDGQVNVRVEEIRKESPHE